MKMKVCPLKLLRTRKSKTILLPIPFYRIVRVIEHKYRFKDSLSKFESLHGLNILVLINGVLKVNLDFLISRYHPNRLQEKEKKNNRVR